mgnify:CR=1 FL=1
MQDDRVSRKPTNVVTEENGEAIFVAPHEDGTAKAGQFRIMIGNRPYEKVGVDKEGRHIYRRS